MDLAQFLAAIKFIEGGQYGRQGQMEEGVRPFGAYGMLEENWETWASSAGLGGHDKWDPAAQDYVASYWATKLYQRYGDWDLVAAAWFAGATQTDKAVSTGLGTGFFQHPNTRRYLEAFNEAKGQDVVQGAQVPRAGRKWINPQGAPKGWLMPIAGPNKYSNSFLVPRSNKMGIHGAIDLYAKKGTPVVAPVGGTVISTRQGGKGGYTARIRGTDGLIYYFAHMDGAAVVKPGERITAGTHVGFVGDSGNAKGTSPHLHFSIRKGNTPVNPYTYLQGSKNSGNYYAPEKADHQAATRTSPKERYTSFLNAISNQVAGGQRLDYRKLTTDEQDEMDDTTVMANKLAAKPTQPKGPVT